MRPFNFNGQPARVVFGFGTISQIPAEADRLGLQRVLVLATPQQASDAEAMAGRLGARSAGTFAKASMHTPVSVTEEAMRPWKSAASTALSRSAAARPQASPRPSRSGPTCPQIVAPTTYAGSEMTPILGETEERAEDHPEEPEGAARGGDLRRRPHPDAAGAPIGRQRHERHRACGRGALRAGPQPDDLAAVRRGHPGAGARPAGHRRRAGGSRGPLGRALRRLALRHRARRRSAWRCITSSATRSAAPSTCPMPKPTRRCCRMLWPTTPRPCPRPHATVARRSARPMPARGLYDLARRLGARMALKRPRHARDRHRQGRRSRHGQSLLEPAAARTRRVARPHRAGPCGRATGRGHP